MRVFVRSSLLLAVLLPAVLIVRSSDHARSAPASGLVLRSPGVSEETGGRGVYARVPGASAAPAVRAPVASLVAGHYRRAELSDRALAPISFAAPVTVSTADTQAAEPSIRVDATDPNHRIWIAAPTGLGARTSFGGVGGDLFWFSDNNGQTWTTVQNATIVGGGDSDVATGNGQEVYVTGLTLANVTLAASCTNGTVFATNPAPTAGTIEDRQWLDTYEDSAKPLAGPDFLLDIGLATLNPAQPENPRVVLYQVQSPMGCIPPHAGLPIDTALAPQGTSPGCPLLAPATTDCYQWPGNLAVDEASGDVYVTYNTLGTDSLNNVPSVNDDKVVVARIDDGASAPATSANIFLAASNRPDTFDSFTVVAVDKAGTVYALWSERHPATQETATMYAYSTNRGVTWSAPIQVNQVPKTTTFPWIVAGSAGKVDIVYYGTGATGPSPETVPGSSQWKVYMAQSLNATAVKPTFEEVVASPVMHQGSICTSGTDCASGTRDLLDFFMVDIDEQGLANIAYTNNFGTPGDGEYVTFVQQNGGSSIIGGPTAVTARSFTARASRGAMELRWRTASEGTMLGFNIFRGTKKLNRALIRARGTLAGGSYRFVDRSALRGATYTYRLQVVNRDGSRSSYHARPVKAR